MTAVSPGGITFISKAYPVKRSDKAIFEKSELINMLDNGDGLMTYKGFLIDDIVMTERVLKNSY